MLESFQLSNYVSQSLPTRFPTYPVSYLPVFLPTRFLVYMPTYQYFYLSIFLPTRPQSNINLIIAKRDLWEIRD